MKQELPSVDSWLKEAKAAAEAAGCGMYLIHNGTVRQTARALVRGGESGTRPVRGMRFSYDAEKVAAAVAAARALPGIGTVGAGDRADPRAAGHCLRARLAQRGGALARRRHHAGAHRRRHPPPCGGRAARSCGSDQERLCPRGGALRCIIQHGRWIFRDEKAGRRACFFGVFRPFPALRSRHFSCINPFLHAWNRKKQKVEGHYILWS